MNIKDALVEKPKPLQPRELDYLTLQQQYRLVEMIYQSSPDIKSKEITELAMRVLHNAVAPPYTMRVEGLGK